MTVDSTRDMSIRLYEYLCRNIVGSEDHVRRIRLMNASNDRISSTKSFTVITSGSFGEGLELQGSDLDIMHVARNLKVTGQSKQHNYHSANNYFFAETDDVKPGFVYLRLIKGYTIKNNVLYQSVGGQLFLSSVLFKQCFLTYGFEVEHGPCVSDEEGDFDFAYCLHSKTWITSASKWITRSNNSWPTSEIKQRVIDHGVLFVPIGTTGEIYEEMKWRISFSVAEKFLIYSFSHTQLLCYVLMKILLKDVISESPGCNDLLCSYSIKTILFWISEEIPTSVWKPENLIPYFMRCIKRLIYCVEQSMCPHYFIPENDLFENKIIGDGRTKLLEKLYILIDYGWQCICISPQISMMTLSCRVQFNVDLFFIDIGKMIKSQVLMPINITEPKEYLRNLQHVFSIKTKKLRSIYLLYLTQNCSVTSQTVQLSSLHSNKYKYKQYTQCLCYILQSTHQDAVTGWLMLASLFYKEKRYKKALYILSYSTTKCTTEKLYIGVNLVDVHRELFRFRTFRKLGLIRSLRIMFISVIPFPKQSSLVPDELKLNTHTMPLLPPVVYLHFLTFMCHYHLHNVRNYQESLGDLRLIIEEDYFISCDIGQAAAYDCLGVAFLVVGDLESAKKAFMRSIEYFPDQLINRSFKRLAMMDFL